MYSAKCSIFINETGSSCKQIQFYMKSYTLIVLLLLCACANHHECNNSDVSSTWCSAYVCIANWLCNKSFVILWNGTSELANQRFLWTWSRVYNNNNCLFHIWMFISYMEITNFSTYHHVWISPFTEVTSYMLPYLLCRLNKLRLQHNYMLSVMSILHKEYV